MELGMLGRDDLEMVKRWMVDIELALTIGITNIVSAKLIMQFLTEKQGVNFKPNCEAWIITLVSKWRSKTPDIKQQSESIALRIFAAYVPYT